MKYSCRNYITTHRRMIIWAITQT